MDRLLTLQNAKTRKGEKLGILTGFLYLAPANESGVMNTYTKHPKPWLRTLPNYHLTFSHSGHNLEDCLEALQHAVNVAVVFTTLRGEHLPETWNGFPVIDGDSHDCRFLDPTGVVVGLRAKGMAKGSQSPFVVVAA
jgi:hypothetical protein